MTTTAEIKKTLEEKMDHSIDAFKNNLTKVRTGRANPALLDTVHVDYYGAMLPLSQVASAAHRSRCVAHVRCRGRRCVHIYLRPPSRVATSTSMPSVAE